MTSRAWLILVLITFASPALAQSEFVQDLFEAQRRSQQPILYSECQQRNGKALLIVSLGTNRIALVEYHHDAVVNTADVEVRENGFVLVDAHGGVYSVQRARQLVEALISYEFKFIMPQQIDATLILQSKPRRKCPAKTERYSP